MDIENICNLLLEALAEAGFNESTLFNYRGVYADSKPFAMKECIAYNKNTRNRKQNSPESEREFPKIGKGHVETKRPIIYPLSKHH